MTRCTLQASNPKTQGDLSAAKDQAETDWAICAAKVDMIVDCQEKNDDKTGFTQAGTQPVD